MKYMIKTIVFAMLAVVWFPVVIALIMWLDNFVLWLQGDFGNLLIVIFGFAGMIGFGVLAVINGMRDFEEL